MYYFMNKKFFTLAAGLMLSTAFGTVSAQLVETPAASATVIKADAAGSATTVKFASGSNYYVVMTGSDAVINSGEFALGIQKDNTGKLIPTSKDVDNVSIANDRDQYLWAVTEVTGSDGKTYYTLYNAKAGAYLAFNNTGALVNVAADAVLNKADQSAYFSFEGAKYAGDGKALQLAADPTKYLDATSITSAGSTTSSKFVLYKAAAITKIAAQLNSMYTGGLGGASFKFATEPDENIFAQKLLAVDLDGVDNSGVANWEANYPAGTYFAVYYPAAGITSEDDFKASTFVSLDLDKNYDLNGLDKTAGQGYGFKVVGGVDMKGNPDIAKGELPAANAAFTVTVTDPSNAPTKFDISLNATVIKDG